MIFITTMVLLYAKSGNKGHDFKAKKKKKKKHAAPKKKKNKKKEKRLKNFCHPSILNNF